MDVLAAVTESGQALEAVSIRCSWHVALGVNITRPLFPGRLVLEAVSCLWRLTLVIDIALFQRGLKSGYFDRFGVVFDASRQSEIMEDVTVLKVSQLKSYGEWPRKCNWVTKMAEMLAIEWKMG